MKREIRISSFYGGHTSRDGFWTKGLGVTLFWRWDEDITQQFLDLLKTIDWHDDYAWHWSAAKDYAERLLEGELKDDENLRPNSSNL